MATQTVETVSVPTEEELSAINKLSRRKLKSEEVFVFSVVLCDNEVDRDNERFSIDALKTLSSLYIGKTGIFDHSMHGRDQCARIFECEVTADENIITSAGETYHCLKAKAYMPRTETNRDLMLEIDAGIKKEVSVGCATAGRTCSICSADLHKSHCGHRLGRYYVKNGKKVKCHAVLSDATDAYEWSFVAVPAQRKAGVTKAFSPGAAKDIDSIIKSLSSGSDVTVTATDSQEIIKLLSSLRDSAADGAAYRDELRKEAMRLALLSQPELDGETAESIVGSMDTDSLKRFNEACTKSLSKQLPICPQLAPKAVKAEEKEVQNYLI